MTHDDNNPEVVRAGTRRRTFEKLALEKLAYAFAALAIGLGCWFWTRQVVSVIELLEMAYG